VTPTPDSWPTPEAPAKAAADKPKSSSYAAWAIPSISAVVDASSGKNSSSSSAAWGWPEPSKTASEAATSAAADVESEDPECSDVPEAEADPGVSAWPVLPSSSAPYDPSWPSATADAVPTSSDAASYGGYRRSHAVRRANL
jgi:hypothetical protein